jgi:integrase
VSSVRMDPKRGTWLYVLDLPRTPDGKRHQQLKRGYRTKHEASAALRAAERLIDDGRSTSAGKLTVGAFINNRWLPTIDADPKLKPSTKAGHRSAAKHLTHAEYGVGNVLLAELAGDDLTRLYDRIRALGRAERTVRYVHSTAHRALKDACRWRLIAFNAAAEATAPAQTPPKPTAWTPNEMARFLDVAAGDRWAALWRLAATTGMRRGELCALRWADLDFGSGTVTVERSAVVVNHDVVIGTPKSGRTRRLGLDAVTLDALKAWRRGQAEERLAFGAGWAGGDEIFTWPDGMRVHPDVITRTFARLVAGADVSPLRLHGLRHSWATNALRAGVRTKVVSDRLGHASTRITEDIYTAFVKELDQDAAEQVAALYRAVL